MEMTTVRQRARTRLDAPAVLLLVLLCALWGLQQVSVKLAVAGGLPPVQQAFARSVLAASCVWLWTAWRGGRAGLRGLLPRGALAWPALLTGIVFAGEFVTLYPGLRLTTASRGVLFLYTSPFIVALGAHLLLPGERLRLPQFAGLAIAFAGVAVALGGDLTGGGGGSPAGDALCLAGAALWAANTLLIKAIPALHQASAAAVLMFQLAGSIPVLLAASLLAGEPAAWPHASALAWACLGYQSVVVAFASYLTWFWLVLRYPAGKLSGFTFATPVFGIAAGAAVLGEAVGVESAGRGGGHRRRAAPAERLTAPISTGSAPGWPVRCRDCRVAGSPSCRTAVAPRARR